MLKPYWKVPVENMLSGPLNKPVLLTLFVFTILFNPASAAQAHARSSPIAIFAPSLAMPLPSPTQGNIAYPSPVSGVLRILVIAAYFTDINYSTSIATLKQQFFGPVNSWAAYYQEISYGSVTLKGDLFGWFQLPYPESHYGHDCLAIDDADCSGTDQSWQIASDAIPLAEAQGVNLSNYDYFVFVHSGEGQESSGVKNDVWSVTYLGGVYVPTKTRTLTKFEIVPELEANGSVPLGVYCHEFGHQLGLPDLYNTLNGKTIMGPWELMDKGLWNGEPPGSSPAEMGAWDKLQLGFISGSMVQTANTGTTNSYTIDPTEVASSNVHVVEVPLSTATQSQYYLIEVRAAIGYDSALPATGVLITYVDSAVTNGRVHVIDGHPSVPGLNDAVWNVGQTFTDTKNNVAVTITGKVGNAYQVTVSRGGSPPPPIQNQTSYVDLAITSVNSQPVVVTSPNTNVTVTVGISNLGTQDATNVQVQVQLDGAVYANLQVNVAAGASTQTSFTWLSTAGSHQFQIIIDPNHLINDTDRSNNIAVFNINVGPTLTINVPLNMTGSNSTLWVEINGVKYNVTSGQLQASAPVGNVTVQIQPFVNSTQGVREEFSGWSDGDVANPRKITVTSNTTLQALFTKEYLLSIASNGGTTSQSTWYKPNSIVPVTAMNPSNVIVNSSRLIFDGWSGDLTSNATSVQLNMSSPISLKANWITQYYVTIMTSTGSPSGSGWYNAGQIATVNVQSTVQYSNATRLIFTGWNSTTLGENPSAQFVVNSPTALQTGWKTQYSISLQSEYGAPQGAGWYDAGTMVRVYVPREIDYANSTRRIFAGWTGDYNGSSANATLPVDAPKMLSAHWNTQYLITFKVAGLPNSTIIKLNLNNFTYPLSANGAYETWLQKGATLAPNVNETIPDGFTVHKFSTWQTPTGAAVTSPMTVTAPETYVAIYSTDFSIPTIPGFPIEGVLTGILLGLGLLIFTRRRQQATVLVG